MTDEKKDDLERAIFHLKRKIEFNERLRCPQVAVRTDGNWLSWLMRVR